MAKSGFSFAGAPKASKSGSKAAVVDKTVPHKLVRDLDHVTRVLAAVTALRETIVGQMKEGEIADTFITEGCRLGRQPENYTACETAPDGTYTAGIQLRKRTSRSELTEEEQELFTDNKIPFDEKVVSFEFDMAKLDADEALRERIEKSLSWLPAGVIVQKTAVVTNEETLKVLFTRPESVVRQMLSCCGTVAVRPNCKDVLDNIQPVVDHVMEMLGMPTYADMTKKAANDPNETLNPYKSKKNGSSKKKAAA